MTDIGQIITVTDSCSQKKILTKYAEKTKGKNKAGKKPDGVDGFYIDEEGKRSFIKEPQDKRELFPELFTGMLLEEMKNRGLIPEVYHSCLICADYIKIENKYVLIQPVVIFEELYKTIGSGTRDNSSRSAFWETLSGSSYYQKLTGLLDYYGLAFILMYSLLLGAYSVHSENIGIILERILVFMLHRFVRYDFGDALRDYGNPANNINILNSSECQGFLNFIKRLTKNYIANFTGIRGLFPKIKQEAGKLADNLSGNSFSDIVCSVLKKIPEDLVDPETQKALAIYMGIDSFKSVTLGPEGDFDNFSTDFINIWNGRLELLKTLEDPAPTNSTCIYQSIAEDWLNSPSLGELLSKIEQAAFTHFESQEKERAQQNLQEKEEVSRQLHEMHQLQQQYQNLLSSKSEENSVQNQLITVKKQYENLLKKFEESKIDLQFYPLSSMVLKIESKAKKEFPEQNEGYRAAHALAKEIRTAVRRYKNEHKDLAVFNKAALEAVDRYKTILERYGWQAILYNVLMAIALVGVGYVIAAAVLRRKERSWLFFESPLRKYPQKLVERIERITNEASSMLQGTA